jgi:hypothetical protein
MLIIGVVFVRVLSPSMMHHRNRWALHIIWSWHDDSSGRKVAEQSKSSPVREMVRVKKRVPGTAKMVKKIQGVRTG